MPFTFTPSEVYAEIQGTIKHMKTYECCLMSCIWMEALGLVDICNQIIQKRDATLDVEAKNINELLNNLRHLAEHWTSIVSDANDLALLIEIEPQIAEKRSNSHLSNEEKLAEFQRETFDRIVLRLRMELKSDFRQQNEL